MCMVDLGLHAMSREDSWYFLRAMSWSTKTMEATHITPLRHPLPQIFTPVPRILKGFACFMTGGRGLRFDNEITKYLLHLSLNMKMEIWLNLWKEWKWKNHFRNNLTWLPLYLQGLQLLAAYKIIEGHRIEFSLETQPRTHHPPA